MDTPSVTTVSPDPARWLGMGEVVRLAVPSVLTTVSFTLMQFVDGWMISQVSKEAMSAQLAGGLTSFVFICFFIGLLSCVSTFASQHLGAGQPEKAALYGWQGVWLSMAAAAILAILIPLAGPLMGLFGHEPAVRELEVPFFQILMAGAVATLIIQALGAFFMGLHRPMVPFIAGVIGNVVNFFAAYGLIFGVAGLPRLELVGAGLGAVIGTVVQAAILGWFFLFGKTSREFSVRQACRVSWPAIKDLVRLGAPAGVMFIGDILLWTIFMGYIMGRFGTSTLAATSILTRYWQMCFMPALGVSTAATAIVGRYCGAGQPRLAWRRAHAALILVEVYMVPVGVIVWLARDPLVGIFNDGGDPEIQSLATGTFIFILLCQAFDALNVIFIGALRGAGDTLWPSILQLALAYGLGLGGSIAVIELFPGLGPYGPWMMASGYIVILGLVMWLRFLGGKWKKMTVVDQGPGEAAKV
jgi:multidrug resistance protein, MATE family